MDVSVPIVVAVIAACTSLVATIVTVIVARQARKAALVQDRFRLMLKLSEERITRLRALAAATERLRASAVLLRTHLQSMDRSNSGMQPDTSRLQSLSKEFDAFWMQWADTKDDVPDADLKRLRGKRHDMQTVFNVVQGRIALGIQRPRGEADDEQLPKAVDALGELLRQLDEFYGEIARLRSESVEAVLFTRPG
jgi:hypothetical protein